MFNNILHLIFYILLFLIFIYLLSYIYHPKSISINQSTLPTFSFNLLYEKQPIVLNDLIPNLSQINTLWFKYNTTSLSSPKHPSGHKTIINTYSYTPPKTKKFIYVILTPIL